MTAPEPELTSEDLEFRFLAGRVSLALTATVGERWRRGFERLREPRDLTRWLREADLAPGRVRVSEAELAVTRTLREAIFRCARAQIEGRQMRAADLATINRCALSPTPAPQLRSGGSVTWKSHDAVSAALSVVARDAIDLFGGRWASRIRECASDECALLFVDLSRPGRRRWCSSETCGSRSRSAAYRSRIARH